MESFTCPSQEGPEHTSFVHFRVKTAFCAAPVAACDRQAVPLSRRTSGLWSCQWLCAALPSGPGGQSLGTSGLGTASPPCAPQRQAAGAASGWDGAGAQSEPGSPGSTPPITFPAGLAHRGSGFEKLAFENQRGVGKLTFCSKLVVSRWRGCSLRGERNCWQGGR